MGNLRIAISVLAYGGQVSAHHARQWLEFGNVLGSSAKRFTLVGFDFVDTNPVDKARNLALAHSMRRSADWLLMIDADTWVEGDGEDDAGFQLARMISEADHAGAAIVVAPVMNRTIEGADRHVMAYRIDPASDKPSRLEPIALANEPRGLIAIDSAATAVIAINLHAANHAQAIFRFTPPSEHGPGLSEDHEFCRQIRERVISTTQPPALTAHSRVILCDTRVRTGHLSRSTPIYNKEPRT